jgi:hypothetical protein
MPPYEKPKTAYDFITKPPTKHDSGSSNRLVLVAGGGLVVVIVLFLFIKLFTGGTDNSTRLLTAAQQQTEIARVATLGTTTGEQTTKNVAFNTSYSITSDSQKLVAVLAENGVKLKQKQLVAKTNPKTDESLKAAKAAANFDETFLKTLDEELADYQATLQDAYDNSNNQAVKAVLSTNFNNAKLLRTQIAESN